jgi:hypothetical protein
MRVAWLIEENAQVGRNATSQGRVAGYPSGLARRPAHTLAQQRILAAVSVAEAARDADLLISVPHGADAMQVAIPGDGLSEARNRGRVEQDLLPLRLLRNINAFILCM